jgi:hypothetical protein
VIESATLQPPAPPHTPQSSSFLPLLGTPSQPAQVVLSPPHTPHASRLAALSEYEGVKRIKIKGKK